MIKFKNHEKEMLLAEAEISIKWAVNGEKSLTGTIYSNDEVKNNIDRGWSLEFENEIYYIIYAQPSDKGNDITVEFDAIHEFFYHMGKSSVYTQLSDGSHTANVYLDFIFKNSGYSYALNVSVEAFEKQSFGMDTRLSLFNNFINQTGLEYFINGKNVTISQKNGNDLSTIVRKGFNLQELNLEFNIGDFVTYCKGFGAFKDENDPSKGRLEVEYTSPLAQIYGKLEAAPFVDERYTIKENLLNKITQLVDNSYSISVALTVEDLQRSGYEYSLPNPGDYIMAVDEALNFSQKIRIVSINISYDIHGNRLQSQVTCGSLSAVEQKNEADADSGAVLDDLINGDGTIPNDWLNNAIIAATEALQSTQTELKYTTNGILAIDKKNANNVVIFNSAGIGVSTDGGKTFANAMTGAGINATMITTGQINGKNLSLNLNTGEVFFKQGKISGKNDRIMFDLNNSLFQSFDTSDAGFKIQYGSMLFYDNQKKEIGFFQTGPYKDKPGIYMKGTKNLSLAGGDASIDIGLTSYGDRVVALFGDVFMARGAEMFGSLTIGGNIGSTGSARFGGDLSVLGKKNAVHPTRSGIRETPAYETAESYLGDIGTSTTDDNCQIVIEIEELFSDIVNTVDYEYQVFLQSYGDGYVYVSSRNSKEFVVKSSAPNLDFSWEIKAKRRGYEEDRLVLNDMTFEELKEIEEKRGNMNGE